MGLALWVAAVVFACLAGVALVTLGWPGDRRPGRRGGALALLGACVIAGGAAAFFLLRSGGLSEGRLRLGLMVCGVSTLALLIGAAVGDRARGRRRCPRCWYAMAGAVGLRCPECGTVAQEGAGLFRTRRRKRVFLAALIPLAAWMGIWAGHIFSDRTWPHRMPNLALALAAPFAKCDTRIGAEIRDSLSLYFPAQRERDWSVWERKLLVYAGRRAQASSNPDEAFYGVAIMFNMHADDATTTAALVGLTRHPDASYVEAASIALGNVDHDVPAAKRALVELLTPRLRGMVMDAAVMALISLQSKAPGGEPPEALRRLATSGKAMYPELVFRLLGLYDPHPESRVALMAGVAKPSTRITSIAALAALWPEDVEVQGLVLETLQYLDGDSEARAALIDALVAADRDTRNSTGGPLPARRLTLYTPAICAELERHIPEFEREQAQFMRDNPRYVLRVATNAEALRRTLDEARRSREGR